MTDLSGPVRYIANNAFSSVVDLRAGGPTADVIGFNRWGGLNQQWKIIPHLTLPNTYYFRSLINQLTYISSNDNNQLVGSPIPRAWNVVEAEFGYRISSSGDGPQLYWTLAAGDPGTQITIAPFVNANIGTQLWGVSA